MTAPADTGLSRRRRPWIFRAIVLLLVLILGTLALFIWLGGPSVPPQAVLVIDLRQGVQERREEGLSGLLGGSSLDLIDLRRIFLAAGGDSRVKGIVLRAGSGVLDLAQAEEIRAMVERFRRSGKPVLGYAEGADGPGYLALSSADEVILDPSAYLDVLGVSLQAVFLGDALRRLGLEFDLVRVGEYKGTYEQLTSGGPSPEFTKALAETADSLSAIWVDAVAASRKIPPEKVRAAVDEAPLSPERALEAKLGDRIAYPDELPRIVAARCGEPAPVPIEAAVYLEAVGERASGPRFPSARARRPVRSAE